MKEVIVVGGGPAGVTAAIYALRGGVKVTLFAKDGGALEKADKISNYYGFPEPISGKELIDRGIEQARNLGVNVVYQEVVGLGFSEKMTVSTAENTYMADSVVLAMGSPRKTPNIKGLAEFEGRGVSYCAVCDGFFFRNKDVAVLGSGEYARHEAEVLMPLVNSIELIEDGLVELRGGEQLEEAVLADGRVLPISGLFVAQGTAGSGDLARKVGAEIDGNRIVANENMETNIPGLFAAGDGAGGLMQISKAVHEGTVAGLSVIKYLKSL